MTPPRPFPTPLARPRCGRMRDLRHAVPGTFVFELGWDQHPGASANGHASGPFLVAH